MKYQVLVYPNSGSDIEIIELEARHMKKQEKGTGLKAIVRRRRAHSKALPVSC